MTALRRPWATRSCSSWSPACCCSPSRGGRPASSPGRAARSEAIADARITTERARPLGRGAGDAQRSRRGDPGAIDRFDREVLDRLLVGDVRRIKIWRTDGTIVYSDKTQLIGKRFRARRRAARSSTAATPRAASPTCSGGRTGSRRGRSGCSRSTPGSTPRRVSPCSSRPTTRRRRQGAVGAGARRRSAGSRRARCWRCSCSAYRCSGC